MATDHNMFMQAVTRNELYGYLHPATREWKEGLMSVTYRDMANNRTNKHQWIVLDGDIDAEWIEVCGCTLLSAEDEWTSATGLLFCMISEMPDLLCKAQKWSTATQVHHMAQLLHHESNYDRIDNNPKKDLLAAKHD